MDKYSCMISLILFSFSVSFFSVSFFFVQIPPSLCYGITITVSIQVELDLGMDVKTATCHRTVPPISDCADVAKTLLEALGTAHIAVDACWKADIKASEAGSAPGAMYRIKFKGESLAKQLMYCVRAYINKDTVPSPQRREGAFDVARFVVLNVKKGLGHRKIPPIAPNATLASSSASSKRTFVNSYGKYCIELPPRLRNLYEDLQRLATKGLDLRGSHMTTGDKTMVIIPHLYVAVLSFSVLNVQFSILELEGELDLELFALHMPVKISVSLQPSIRARGSVATSAGGKHANMEGLFDGKPTIGAIASCRPYLRTLSGRLFAKVTLFGRSFMTPPLDWSGLKFFINHWCMEFGESVAGKCFPDGSGYTAPVTRLDPPLRPPKGTESCVPCFFGKPEEISYFAQSRGVGASLLCPPTPARTVQFAGMLHRRRHSIFPMGLGRSGRRGDSYEQNHDLGRIFYQVRWPSRRPPYSLHVVLGTR